MKIIIEHEGKVIGNFTILESISKRVLNGDILHAKIGGWNGQAFPIGRFSSGKLEPEKSWSFYMNDEFFDAEFNSRGEAYEHADAMFAQECEDEDVRSNASREVRLVQFYTDDAGERKEVHTEATSVEFEYYQGDYAEHNTMGNLV